MQLKTIISLGFASMAVAVPAIASTREKFDLPAITDTFTNIQNGIDKMAQDVRAYKGDPQQLAVIQTDSGSLQKIIQDGTAKIKTSPAMGLMDAIGVLGPVGVLSSKVDDVITALASNKETFTKMNVGGVVVQDLKVQKAAADQLVAAILANLPLLSLLGIIAGPIAKQVTDKLDAGIKAWS
jgi:hypothetical protein